MRTLNFMISSCLVLLLSNCASVKEPSTPIEKPKKNPISVSFYTHDRKPATPYVVLGKETISKYNRVGIKRQEAMIKDAMRSIAASMGGDAVMDIHHDSKNVVGTVIVFKKSNTKPLYLG